MAWEEPPHRHTLTPIGDELERRNEPLEIGQPSELDKIRREVSAIERLIPVPKTRFQQVTFALVWFAIIVGASAAALYAIGLLIADHTSLTHNHAQIVAFLIGGVALATPPAIINFGPFATLALRLFWFRRSPAADDDNPEAGAAFEEELAHEGDRPPVGVGQYGVWQLHWFFWMVLGVCMIGIGFAVWGRST